MERDFDTKPYTADERKVVDYLTRLTPDIGAGDDPITFLIASHVALRADLAEAEAQIETLERQLSA
jgi:hypothetical protein